MSIKLGPDSEHNLWSDLTMNVANGGVFVATFHPLALGTVVHLLLTVEGADKPIATQGVVRWTRPHRDGSDGAAGVGVRFVDLDPHAIDTLARFVENVREPMIFELDDVPMRKKRA